MGQCELQTLAGHHRTPGTPTAGHVIINPPTGSPTRIVCCKPVLAIFSNRYWLWMASKSKNPEW
eukprot:1144660-Pelagomonas_calceolata.AAC.4